MFDVEKSMAEWRRGFDGLREEDIDELESHLRDELDALAEVGIVGRDAFVHAAAKIGPSSEVIDQLERAAPSAAWRAPAMGLLTGFLVNVLGGAILSVVDWSVIGLGCVVRPGAAWVYLALVMVIVVAPIVTLGGGFRLASRIVERVARMPAWTRIAIVLGMGFFVLVASIPIGVVHVSRELVQQWAAWRAFTGPARNIVGFALPFVFVGVLCLARRRGAHGVVWASLGYLAKSFGASLWLCSATSAAWIVSHVSPTDVPRIERAATMVSILLPAMLVMLAVSLRTRITPAKLVRTPLAPLVGLALAGGGWLMQVIDHRLIGYDGFFRGGYEAIMWSHLGVGILASLCLAPLAAAGLLRLRSA